MRLRATSPLRVKDILPNPHRKVMDSKRTRIRVNAARREAFHMDYEQILEHVSEECERLGRLCRIASPELSNALLLVAWMAMKEIIEGPIPPQ